MGDCPKLRPVSELILVTILSIVIGFASFISLLVNVIRKGPSVVFGKRKRNVRPDVLTKPVYGSHEYIRLQTVRLKLHCVVSGPADKPLILFLHGFPEFWYSWRHQIKEFSKDYRTVAVDMRGYGESDRPCGIYQYTLDKLVEDVDQLITALGYKKCILVAHDWGGAVAWSYAAVHPDRVEKLVVGNCPHAGVFNKFLKSSFAQLRKSWYMFLFQVPVLPQVLFGTGDHKMLEEAFTGKVMGAKRGSFTQEDIEAFKYTFSEYADLTGPINYYRAVMRYQSPQVESAMKQKITVPTLLIWGTSDGALDKRMAELSGRCCTDFKVQYIEGTSHWVQQEEPEQFNSLMRQFLKDGY